MTEKSDISSLFTASGCISAEGFELFLEGRLHAEQNRALRDHLDSCDLCAEAIAGLSKISDHKRRIGDIDILNRKLRSQYTVVSNRGKYRTLITVFSAAATLVLLVGLFFLFRQRSLYQEKAIAQNLPAPAATKSGSLVAKQDDTIRLYAPAIETGSSRTGKNISAGPANRKPEKNEAGKVREHVLIAEQEADAPSPETASGRSAAASQPKQKEFMDDSEPIAAVFAEPGMPDEETLSGDKQLKAERKSNARKSSAGTSGKRNSEEVSNMVADSKDQASPAEAGNAYDMPEEEARFRGKDIMGFAEFVSKNVIYPPGAAEKGIGGKVIISFVIDENGKLTDARIIQSADSLLDQEALRVVKTSPLWTPAKRGGRAIKAAYAVPVLFELQEKQ